MNEFSSVVVSKWANSPLRNLPAVRERANGCVSALSEHCEYEQIAIYGCGRVPDCMGAFTCHDQ